MGFTTYEPAPHTAYYHTGIGGAGNYRRLTASEIAAPRPRTSDVKTQPRPFYGGRGGVGNAHGASERAIFSFDEELQRDKLRRDSIAPMYTVGRGGAGNIVPHEEEGIDVDIECDSEADDRVSLEGSVRRMSETSIGQSAGGYSSRSLASNADRIVNRIRNFGRHH
ncbi:hypothetical protein DRE_00157 [Drechslerella stenobrocha 248]|uniref:Uncharacterized protein n=1 Tax=Drechslerella stenobrocha 248 TaxID=1043628 RepID=W7I9S6_9PEZI|nr:hypothetical protein DRE_00157 [Drechslerella stenobrocha 248]